MLLVRLFNREWLECPASVLEALLPLESIREIDPDHVPHGDAAG